MTTQLPLIDKSFGISQLGGNEQLFIRMIEKFQAEFEAAPQKIINSLKNNDWHEARMEIHTTKGITGNLGFRALFECSKQLNAQIKQEKVEDSALAEFAMLMQQTCEAIAELIRNGDFAEQVNESSINARISAVNTLVQKIKANEFIDDDDINTINNDSAFDDINRTALVNAIEALDYDTALKLLAE